MDVAFILDKYFNVTKECVTLKIYILTIEINLR